jgi:hypothetical protein
MGAAGLHPTITAIARRRLAKKIYDLEMLIKRSL